MKRISVTTIEKFRRYMTEASAFDTEDALLESIKGVFKGNDKTQLGGAYHQLIEGKFESAGDEFKAGDFIFTVDQARPALDYRLLHPLMVHEMNVQKIYETRYGPIQVTGRVDSIDGIQVRDVKTKFSYLDVQEYMDSCQWKFYLDAEELDTLIYDVFIIKGFESLPFNKPYKLDIRVEDPVEIRCDRYHGMSHDLKTQLNDFMDYIHNRKLFDALKPAIQTSLF
jgi:hypothetical protein